MERSRRITVFAPSLVLTVTIERRGEGDAELHLHAGGQGLWVARMAAELGAEVSLCTALGGETGTVIRALIGDERVELAASHCAGANGSYVHDRRSGGREPVVEIPGRSLSRHELDDVYGVTLARMLDSEVLVLTGSQDPDLVDGEVYTRLASDARANGIAVVADLTGDPLAGALAGGVFLLKLSAEEMYRDGLVTETTPEALVKAAETLVSRGAENVVISRAADPALAFADGALLQITGPRITAADTHGTGDSMTAGAAVGLGRGLPLMEALRLAAAAGAVNATRHGLGTGSLSEIERVESHVHVRSLAFT